MPGTAHRPDRLEGARAAGHGDAGAGCQPERRGSADLEIAREARRRRGDQKPARLGLSSGRSEERVTSSISRQLVLWLAVPLMLLALCGALVHYFNNVAPGVIGRDQRLKDAAAALMAHLEIDRGTVRLDTAADRKPPMPSADSIQYALRSTDGKLLSGTSEIPASAGSADAAFAMERVGRRTLRTLSK